MSVIAGIDGAVDGISTCRKWNVSASSDLQAVIASNTKAGRLRLAGNKDWNGGYSAYGHTPLKLPGDSFTFTGKTATKAGPTVIGVEGVALVDQVVIVIDIEAALPIAHEVSFSSNGVLNYADDLTDFSDTTVPDPPSSIGCKLQVAEAIATPVFADVLDVRVMTLTLTRDNPSYVSSESAAQTKRVMGNFDCSLGYSIYQGDPTIFILPDAVKHVRMFVDATTYWELKWLRYGEVSDVEVNRETDDIIGAAMNAFMHGFTDVGGTQTEGFIKNPATTQVWPAT